MRNPSRRTEVKDSPEPETYVRQLLAWFARVPSVVVAFSGGVDSTVLAAVARRGLGDRAVAVTADAATFARQDLEEACQLAADLKIRHVIVWQDALADPAYVENGVARCFVCREDLSRLLWDTARALGIDTVVAGVIADDLVDFRPGIAAFHRAGVQTPLADLGLGKHEVRALARFLRLPAADKPSNACLSSRIPYGTVITREALERIEAAEAYVARCLGTRLVRVRDHDGLARIELSIPEQPVDLASKLRELVVRLRAVGFRRVTLDVEGYRSGSLNALLRRQLPIIQA